MSPPFSKELTDMTPERVIGRYAIFDEIGAGGMATVHLGRLLGAQGFSRTVAIKRLHANFAKDPEFAEMFLDEARLAARIQHPNVVPTLDVVTGDGELYLIMDYVQGESLARLRRETIARRETVPYPLAVAVMVGVLHGLHAAHEAKSERGEPLGIVHRDVSPHNVLVGIDGIARVLDFGVAKAVWRQQTTKEGQLKGKLAYMAPEQFDAQPIDRRVDVYAAAVTLWEALVGRRLFDAENPIHVMSMITSMPIPAPSSIVPGIPRALDEVVLRGLARRRDDRYATARDMAIALEDLGMMATQRETGEWVETIAGDRLVTRARKVAEVEGVSTIIARPSAKWVAAPDNDRPSQVPTRTDAALRAKAAMRTATPAEAMAPMATPSLGETAAVVDGRRRTAWGVPVLLAVLAGGAAFAIGMQPTVHYATPGTGPAVAAAFDVIADANAQVPSLAIALPGAPAPIPPPTTMPDPPAPPPPPPPPASVSAKPPPVAKPAPVSVAPKPAKKSDCSPPYTVDAQGIRHPKVQCL